MRIDYRTAVAVLLIACIQCAGRVPAAERDQQPAGILLLRNGSSIEGTFRELDSGDAVAWQGTEFTSPFEFVLEGVTSVNFPPVKPRIGLEGEFAVELRSGDLISGRLLDVSEGVVKLDTPRFGPLQIRQQSIRRIDRIDENPSVIYSGVTGLSDWDQVKGTWRSEGAELRTDDADASVIGDFGIPDRAVVEFHLSWDSTPNFSFAIGVDPDARRKTSAGWYFDTWNSQLTLVRERDEIAVVEPVLKLDAERKEVRLIVFLDQPKNSILVYRPDGTLLVKASLPGEAEGRQEGTTTGIALFSHFGGTRLKRLRVSHWDGSLPLVRKEDLSRFRLKDGKAYSGEVTGFNPDTRTVTVQQKSDTVTFPIDELVTAEFVGTPPGQNQPLIVALQDQSRLSGLLLSVSDRSLRLQCPDSLQPIDVDLSLIRSVSITNDSPPNWEVSSQARMGHLEFGEYRLRGHLIPATVTDRSSCLVWQPDYSRTSSPMRRDSAGRIIYREIKPTPPPEQTPQRQQPRTIFGQFGQLFLKNAQNPRQAANANSQEPHDLHLISGDVLPCLVKSIDERGLHIEGSAAEVDLIPHEKVKALVLDRSKQPPELDDEKKLRLLTLPRNQKGSPPTHILHSENGDFLRCRLNEFTAEHMRIEIHLAEMDIPSQRISHIIWLHPENLLKKNTASENELEQPLIAEKPEDGSRSELHAVQVLMTGDNRSTFVPREITDERILGVSDVIGGCSYSLKVVDQIIFGSQIESAALDLPYHQWALTPATEPLYLTADDGGPSDDGLASSFVGKPAPDFQLKLLSGGKFVLSEAKGKIIVLDFWATWCGPCMLTMPLMEEAMAQFPSERVQMISVNLEEPADKISEVLTRHELNPKVALDIDGAVARRYQVDAIPQLFIIDTDGTVARVYIGGGKNVVEQFTASLQELLDSKSAPDSSGS